MRLVCLLGCLLMCLSAAAEETAYRQDGQYMLTLTEAAALYAEPSGEAVVLLETGARLIATGVMRENIWHEVYLPGTGYGYVSGGAVPDEPQRELYQPGFGLTVGLFSVTDPSAVRVEITSPDGLEYPIVHLDRIFSRQQEEGWLLCAGFSTAADICKTSRERICATLYDAQGQPLAVKTLIFDTLSRR